MRHRDNRVTSGHGVRPRREKSRRIHDNPASRGCSASPDKPFHLGGADELIIAKGLPLVYSELVKRGPRLTRLETMLAWRSS